MTRFVDELKKAKQDFAEKEMAILEFSKKLEDITGLSKDDIRDCEVLGINFPLECPSFSTLYILKADRRFFRVSGNQVPYLYIQVEPYDAGLPTEGQLLEMVKHYAEGEM